MACLLPLSKFLEAGAPAGQPQPCCCIAGNSKGDDPELELLEFRDNPAGTGPGDGPAPGNRIKHWLAARSSLTKTPHRPRLGKFMVKTAATTIGPYLGSTDIAYFTMEIALRAEMHTYSGGLG